MVMAVSEIEFCSVASSLTPLRCRKDALHAALSKVHTQRYWLNGQVALLDADMLSVNALLGTELELEVTQLQGMRKAFIKEEV
jgi:hypothetical protein